MLLLLEKEEKQSNRGPLEIQTKWKVSLFFPFKWEYS